MAARMTAALEDRLRDPENGVAELRALLAALLAGPGELAIVVYQALRPSRVYRLRLRRGEVERSYVVKRLSPDRSQREQRAVRRWLPRLGLGAHASPLLGVAAVRDGAYVWHVYEDLGERTLASAPVDPDEVRAAVRLVAEIHVRFAESGLLGECREFGMDLGPRLYAAGVRDALRALEALRRGPPERIGGPDGPVARLLERLAGLRDAEPEKTRRLAAAGGPETLLHGDLWTSNVLVRADAESLHVRLIDWEQAGVGSVTYDLSAFLLRFPAAERAWILDCYADAARRLDWAVPDRETLNALFETAETARIVSSLLWAALELLEKPAAWAVERLAEAERWLDALGPVLPAVR